MVLRRAGVELFPKFTVTNIEAGGVLEATLDAVSGESYTDVAGHARATGPVRVPGVIVTARDEEQGVEVEWHLELLPGGLVRQKATVTNLFGADAGAPLEESARSSSASRCPNPPAKSSPPPVTIYVNAVRSASR